MKMCNYCRKIVNNYRHLGSGNYICKECLEKALRNNHKKLNKNRPEK